MQSDITISLAQIVWIAGGITAIAAVIRLLMKPIRKLDDHEQRIQTLEQTAEENKATDRYITRALNAIVNHMIDGNGIDKLKEVRDEFQNEIIKK